MPKSLNPGFWHSIFLLIKLTPVPQPPLGISPFRSGMRHAVLLTIHPQFYI